MTKISFARLPASRHGIGMAYLIVSTTSTCTDAMHAFKAYSTLHICILRRWWILLEPNCIDICIEYAFLHDCSTTMTLPANVSKTTSSETNLPPYQNRWQSESFQGPCMSTATGCCPVFSHIDPTTTSHVSARRQYRMAGIPLVSPVAQALPGIYGVLSLDSAAWRWRAS